MLVNFSLMKYLIGCFNYYLILKISLGLNSPTTSANKFKNNGFLGGVFWVFKIFAGSFSVSLVIERGAGRAA